MNNAKSLFAALAVVSAGTYATPALPQGPAPSVAVTTVAPKTGAFKGAEVNGGFATLTGRTLKLSADFNIPKAPAPTWQVVDKEGNVYLLKQLNIVGGRMNRSVDIPAYVKSVSKVRIYCTFAEVNLGEASFPEAIALP